MFDFFFFFQAEDGIRDLTVTGVQTCALPISVATQIPGVGVTSHSSNGGYHTFEMEADALGEVGHHAFTLDAQTMAAVLYHYATDAPYRAPVQREFAGPKALYGASPPPPPGRPPLPPCVHRAGPL